jgi:uncharacterized protein YigE (DUF2233 family)
MGTTKGESLGADIRFVEKKLMGPRQLTLRMIIFDEAKAEIRVVRNNDRNGAKSLAEWGAAVGAVAVCNGGYFEVPTFQPAGLEVVNGERRGVLFTRPGAGGALVVTSDKAALVWDDDFKDNPSIKHYLQCSPWLVSDGNAWPYPADGTPDRKNARTFIATDGNGKWVIGTVKVAGLSELGQMLSTPGIIPGMMVKRALNLDGGPSSGLWFKTLEGVEDFEQPGWIVRNGIVIVPR